MISLHDVLVGTGGVLYQPLAGVAATSVSFHGVVIDSRAVEPGDLFVAVRGEVHDGHRFVPDAVARGAAGAIVAAGRAAEFAALGVPLVEAPDTLVALSALATSWRAKYGPAVRVVGITGSVGKSSTKELAAALLGRYRRVLKSPKSYNNEFGLPLSVLLLRPETEVALLEMGTYGPGELTALAAIARPDVTVVTNVGHSHLERMGTQEAIAAAKGELVAALPEGGVAVLNADDPRVRPMASLTRARPLFYGLGASADLRATGLVSHGLDGLSFTLHYQGEARPLERLPLFGAHHVYTALAAAGIGLAVGLTLDEVAAGLRVVHAPVRLVPLAGPGGSTILDDSYNASPASTLAALALLAELPAGRRIAVLGDMLELGAYEVEGHREVGRAAAAVADELITVGPRARLIAEEALRQGLAATRVRSLPGKEELGRLLRGVLTGGDVVLIKGSRGLALETVIAELRGAAR